MYSIMGIEMDVEMITLNEGVNYEVLEKGIQL